MIVTQRPAVTRRRLLFGLGAAGLSLGAPPSLSPAFAWSTQRPKGTVSALAFDQGNLVLAANGIWISSDGGMSFSSRSEGPGAAVAALATHVALSGVIYAATPKGLQRSEDAGLSWHPAGSGLPASPVDAVAIAAHDPQTIYAAVRGDGLWQSRDGAKSWDFAMDRPLIGKVERDVVSLVSVGITSGMGGIWVFAGTEAGMAKVPDCFCRWSELGNGAAMSTLASGRKTIDVVARKRLPSEHVRNIALAPSAPKVLFAALPSGIWKTQDTGETWGLLSAALASHCLAVDPNDPNHIVAADAGGTMLVSRDGGVTWAAPTAL